MKKIGLIVVLFVLCLSFVGYRYHMRIRLLEMMVEKCGNELEMSHKKRRMQISKFAHLYKEDPERFFEISSRLANIGHSLYGVSSESYVVNSDGKRYTKSRFEQGPQAGQPIDLEAVSRALKGESGSMDTPIGQGINYYIIYSSLAVGDETWAIITEIDAAELAEGNCSI